jgi:ferritin-like metal-binding protein YciE
MPVNNPQEMFVLLLSDVRRKTERSIDFYREASKVAEEPEIKEAIEAREFVAQKSLDKIDEAFKLINQKPVTLTGRTEEVFVEDFRRELAEIKSPVVKRSFVLSKLMHLTHWRIGE